MAEFRLGRIKFVWQGDWAGGTTYYQDDVIRYGGRTYICVIGHTADSSFYTDLDFAPTRWNLLTDGQTWKDDWTTNTFYALNDIVKYGGNLYIATTAHTSAATSALGLEANQANWTNFAQGIDWKGAWATNTRYKINDVVSYGGKAFIATAGHTSQALASDGLEADIANWEEFNEGIAPKGDWATTTRYKVNDVVKYGAGLWICTAAHTSDGTTFNNDVANWDQFVEGFKFEDTWSDATEYKQGDVVVYGGNQYVSKTINTNANPVTQTSDWGELSKGFSFQNDWASGTAYKVGEVVRLRGYTYLATADSTGQEPPNASYWTRLTSGLSWQGEWLDDQAYKLGDVVRYDSNAYVCVLGHISEGDDFSTVNPADPGGGNENSRPDLDVTGTYWNVLSIGSETAVMTARGDMVYYSGSGPARLPIGTEGQILRAGTEDPEWVTLGETDHVYYVAPQGVDGPAPINGLTLDKPFKTIRYACEQVELGPRNPNAKRLLTLNKAFIQREIVEWTNYQITNNTAPFTTAFTYDTKKCERDMGYIIEALIHDIGHSSNEESRKAALSYVNDAGNFYTLGQEAETVASIEYGLALIENVLNQEAPATNYQAENSDSAAFVVVDQYFEAGIQAEAGALAELTSNVTIITDAITAGEADNIPAEYVPTKIINVKTGKYREVLPIIVPRETCILGDELRSVNAGPAGSLFDDIDSYYSMDTLERLKTVVSEVVVGTTVSASTGNTLTQNADFPYADTEEQNRIDKLIDVMMHNIDYKIGGRNFIESSSSIPVGYNTSFLAGYGDAKRNILGNKKFLQEEIIQYINNNYSTLKYSKTSCRRDVGWILDSVAYDITYGGNSQSINAGLAYYDGRDGDSVIDVGEKAATTAAWTYLKNLMISIAQAQTVTPLNSKYGQFKTTAGSAGAGTRIGELLDIIIGIVNLGTTNAPNVTVTDIATNVVTTSTSHGLSVGDRFRARTTSNGFVKNTNYWIISTPAANTFTVSDSYGGSVTSLTNGSGLAIVGDVVESATVDTSITVDGGASIQTDGEEISGATQDTVYAVIDELNKTNWHTDFIIQTANLTATTFQVYVGKSSIVHTYVSGGTVTKADGTVLNVQDFDYDNLTGQAEVTTTANHGLVAGDIVDIEEVLVTCTDAGGVRELTFPRSLSTDGQTTKTFYIQNKCIRDTRLVIDAVIYDYMFGIRDQVVRAGRSYLRANAADVYTKGQKASTLTAYETAKDYILANVTLSATDRFSDVWDKLDTIIYGGTTEGSNQVSDRNNVEYAARQIELNRDFIVAEASAWTQIRNKITVSSTTASGGIVTHAGNPNVQKFEAIEFSADIGGLTAGTTYYVYEVLSDTTFTVSATRYATSKITLIDETKAVTADLVYDDAKCRRDVNRYIDAIIYDLKYPGNYKSYMAARYYANGVIGSLEEDMYYVRNATGIRNQTLADLSGDLGPANAYGTRRPTAGAYVSLDPGWGPKDERVWINARSPYVQNVTTFGTAAVGQKIDGALHDGGNDSIVSNDFTQVISDGIGAWITNNGRAELVSVFTYYGHIGYLAENGGRIRGTNGNNSYGDFGSVAEGFDNRETPGTAIVDNRFQYVATVGDTITDGAQEILQLAFDNAGNNYSDVTWELNGAGTGVRVEQTDFRDDAVFDIRLLDNVDDSTNAPEADGNFGGTGYLTNANTAQGGTSTSLTIAATDDELSSAYIGMKLLLTGGSGAGQFGIIESYNAGNKIANIVKREKEVALTSISASSKYVITSLGNTDFTAIGASATPFVGEIFTATGAGSGTGTVDSVSDGWDNIRAGNTIVTPDASTTYVIEPEINFSEPAYENDAGTSAGSLLNGVYFIGLQKTFTNVSASGGKGNSATFDVTVKNQNYTVTLNTAGNNYERNDTLTILGSLVGGENNTNDITITLTSVNSTNGEVQAFDITGNARGGKFMGVASGVTSEYSYDGVDWTESGTNPSFAGGTQRVASVASGALTAQEVAGSFIVGRSYTILTVSDTAYTSIGALSNQPGTIFVATGVGAGSGTATPNQDVAVAINPQGYSAYSYDGGLTWTQGAQALSGSGGNMPMSYGNGKWMVIEGGTSTGAITANGGTSWTAISLPVGNNWADLEYGAGTWVAVASDSNTIAYSTDDGNSWTTAVLTAAGNTGWNSVAFGNNKWIVANDNANADIAYSNDNADSWTILDVGFNNDYIVYGGGVFALTNSTTVHTSSDGINWTQRAGTVPANATSSKVAFGNPNYDSMFVYVDDNSTTTNRVRAGARAKARAYVSETKIFAIRITDPGSNYTSTPSMSITDPNNIYEAPVQVRVGNGVIGIIDFKNRGAGYVSASASISDGNGYADIYQSGNFIAIRNSTNRPVSGSNVVFSHLPDQTFKLVNVLTFRGDYEGSYNAFFQISPEMPIFSSPEHGVEVTTRIRYSQVRLTGHDFLDIGTGNFENTNYPGLPLVDPNQDRETVDSNGGRVFYTSTDQDGNFRVGELFTIEQSTGIATLNADAFNIAGLQELTLGEVTLGGGSATIEEFSTDPFFTQDSDSVIPTQRAIKAYISSQIGGGGASLNVNSVTSGFIYIANDQITTTTGGAISVQANVNFQGGVTGLPIAWNYFLT